MISALSPTDTVSRLDASNVEEEKRPMTDFNGRTILVTGATGGIGGATVRHLVDAGADVIASGQSEEGLKTLVDDAGVRALPFDLASEDSVRVALDGLDVWGW
jgi:L-xylulose reductase